MLTLVLVFLALASLALLSQAGDTLELRNSYNITGIRSPEDPLDWDPIENTTLLAINVLRDRLDIWNITSETKIESFYTDRLIVDVVCSPDSRYIAIAGSRSETNRQTLAVYDITTWADTYTGDDTPSEWSTDGDWSSDGQRFALGSRDGLVYVYDTSTWKRIYILQGPDSDEVEEVEFSTDGTLLAAGIGSYIRVFNLTTLRLVWSNFSGSGTVRWMPGTHKLLQNRQDIVDGDDGWKLVQQIDGFRGRFHPSGKYLASGGRQGLSIYNTEDWTRYGFKAHSFNFSDLKWGMGGDVLYTYGDNSTIRCWIVVGGVLDDRPPTVNVTSPTEDLSFEGPAYALGTASDDHGVQYVFLRIDDGPWQLATGTESWSWTDHTRSVPPGDHALHVRAYDGQFYSATTVVNFTLISIPIPDLPPRLHLLSPQDGDTVQAEIRVIARAEDENSTLLYEVGMNESLVFNFTGGLVWNRTLDLSGVHEGPLRIWARAFDGTHWSNTTEATVQVFVPPEPDLRPIVSITEPTNLEIVFGNVTISGTTFDDHRVDFVVLEVDGQELVIFPDAWEWSFLWDSSTVSDGYHNITGWAWDGVQRSGNTTVTLLVRQPANYFVDVGVVILQPLPDQQLSDLTTVRVDVSSTPIGYFPERVWLRVDQLSPRSVAADENFSIRFDTHLVENGRHVFHVWVTGHGISSGEAEVSVTVLNTVQYPNDPPTILVETPWDGVVVSGTAEFLGTATDDHDLLAVEVRVGVGDWMAADGGARWSFHWDSTTVTDGGHRVHFRSYDGENYSEEVSMELLVDNVREDSKPDSSNTVMILIAIVLALAVTGAYLQLRRS